MKILLGMSGGLDSTYAALKLIEEGHTVEGAVLVMHDYTEVDAAKVAAGELNIPLHIIDCRNSFEKCVVQNFVNEYLSARTPNPCIICNSEIKFRFLHDYAVNNGFDRIATGHYARIEEYEADGEKRYAILRAKDTRKDQTYMLWRLPQDILSRIVFPLADDEKQDVKTKAKEKKITAADMGESQEICFIPTGDYADFIEKRSKPMVCGNFIDTDGNVLGTHKGIARYTVGQRKGLGISAGQRVFVTEINPTDNTVTLSANEVLEDTVFISGIVFSGIKELHVGEEITLSVKLRYLAKPVECSLKYLGEGKGIVRLAVAQRAVTPGQSAVFYQNDRLVLGGFICRKNGMSV